MKQKIYKTQFVDRMPPDDTMEDGVLYVAPHFHVAVHKCMCGCGEKVVTPLGRDNGGWAWSFDGTNIRLHPSIGNFQYDCKSHYFIADGEIRWV